MARQERINEHGSANQRHKDSETATSLIASLIVNDSTGRLLLPRHARILVEEALADTPVVVVQGARQVGKSTLTRQVLQGRPGRALSLDDTAVQAAAVADPDGFLTSSPP